MTGHISVISSECFQTDLELFDKFIKAVRHTPGEILSKTEFEKRLNDLDIDFYRLPVDKEVFLTEDCVAYFYYCVPESLAEKAKTVILENKRKTSLFPVSEKDCPALLTYDEKGGIRETDFGTAKRYGRHHELSPEDRIQAGRLGTLRYWNLLEETIAPEDRGLQARMRGVQDENRTLKLINRNIEEDYNLMKRFLRYQHPGIWEEFLNIDSPGIEKLKEI